MEAGTTIFSEVELNACPIQSFMLQSGEQTPAWLSTDDPDQFSETTWPGHGFGGTVGTDDCF